MNYFRESRNNFRQSENLREETEATLDMAAATYHSKDVEKAIRLYSSALDLADEQKSDKLAKSSLTNLASLYVISGKKTGFSELKKVRKHIERTSSDTS